MASKLDGGDKPVLPVIPLMECPMRISLLHTLGKKWSLLILRDIGMRHIRRFNDLLRSLDDLTPRVLSMRLKELESEGIIHRAKVRRSPRFVEWSLTSKGKDVLPIIMSYTAFGAKWYADKIFRDGRPRGLDEIFPNFQFQTSLDERELMPTG